jgi:hypothetical protein
VIDAPSDRFAGARDFWAAALGAVARRLSTDPEFTALVDPAAVPVAGLQEIVDDQARFHVDLETDDVPAEVSRLLRLRAEEVSGGASSVVLRDPAGLLLCVLPAESADVAERSRPVPDPR